MSNRLLQSNAATSINSLSEEELLASALDFGEAALGELYDRYEGKIYAYIYRRTGEPELAKDLTAQVFIKMLEAIRKQKAWTSSFSGWLYRIAHNVVIDYYRRRKRHKQVSIDDAPTLTATRHNPVQTAEQNMDAEQLRAAIQRLTDEQAEVVSLRFLEGYSIAEVAVMMEKTEGSIKALQYRAVSSLRQLLQHEMQ
jgi:RNA polymerase sigma-70 factor (ECF subfamily)